MPLAPLLERVRADRDPNAAEIDPTDVGKVRRLLLNGDRICAKDVVDRLGSTKSALPHAADQLEAVGYIIAKTPGPFLGAGMGRPATYYQVTNLEHEPREPKQRAPKVKASANGDKAPTLTQLMREVVLAGDVFYRKTGYDLGFTDKQMTKSAWNLSRDKRQPLKIVQTLERDGFILKGKAPKPKGKALAKTSRAVEHVNGNAASSSLLGMLDAFGNLKVRGLSLDDDNNVMVALRDGEGTWLLRVEGRVEKATGNERARA